jgi:hypothetical protein
MGWNRLLENATPLKPDDESVVKPRNLADNDSSTFFRSPRSSPGFPHLVLLYRDS